MKHFIIVALGWIALASVAQQESTQPINEIEVKRAIAILKEGPEGGPPSGVVREGMLKEVMKARIAERGGIGHLVKIAQESGDENERAAALIVLGAYGPKAQEALSDILVLLKGIDSEESIRKHFSDYHFSLEAIAQLVSASEASRKLVAKEAEGFVEPGNSSVLKITGIRLLEPIAKKEARAFQLLFKLSDSTEEADDRVRAEATRALPSESVLAQSLMIRLLNDKDEAEGQRAAAAFSLGNVLLGARPEKSILQLLENTFLDTGENEKVRKSALLSLAHYYNFSQQPSISEKMEGGLESLWTDGHGIKSADQLVEMKLIVVDGLCGLGRSESLKRIQRKERDPFLKETIDFRVESLEAKPPVIP